MALPIQSLFRGWPRSTKFVICVRTMHAFGIGGLVSNPQYPGPTNTLNGITPFRLQTTGYLGRSQSCIFCYGKLPHKVNGGSGGKTSSLAILKFQFLRWASLPTGKIRQFGTRESPGSGFQKFQQDFPNVGVVLNVDLNGEIVGEIV